MKNSLIALVALIPLTTACANHVRFVDMKSDGREQKLAASRVVVAPQVEILDAERIALHFTREDRIESHSHTSVTKVDEYTPYSVVHELYEIPIGAVSVPISMVFNVVDCLLLGYVPNRLVDGYTYWTFAALNPIMNTESGSRVEQREVAAHSEDGAVSEEQIVAPLHEREVEVRLDQETPVSLRTDAMGDLQIDLLALTTESRNAAHKLTVSLAASEDSGDATVRTFYVGRALSERLQTASESLRVLRDGSVSASALASAVQELDRLGFRAQSLRFEDEIRARLESSPVELAVFSAALSTRYVGAESAAAGGATAMSR